MKLKNVKLGLKPVLTLIMASMFLTSVLWYVFAATPTSTYWITPGIYPSVPTFTVWMEGGNCFSKNENGEIEFNGSNATEVLQATINATDTGENSANGHDICTSIIAVKSDLVITGTINLTRRVGLKLLGMGLNAFGTKIEVQRSLSLVFDLTGSRHLAFEGLNFEVHSSYAVTNLFLLGRDSTGVSCGDHKFESCQFSGDCTQSVIYNYGSESNIFIDCFFYCPEPAMIMTRNNHYSVTSVFATIDTGVNSMSDQKFFGGTISGTGSPTDARFIMEGTYTTNFYSTYISSNQSYMIQCVYNTTGDIGQIGLHGCQLEGFFMTEDNQRGSMGYIDNVYVVSCKFAHYGNMIALNASDVTCQGWSVNLVQGRYNYVQNWNFSTFIDGHISIVGFPTWSPYLNFETLERSWIEIYDNARFTAKTTTNNTIWDRHIDRYWNGTDWVTWGNIP